MANKALTLTLDTYKTNKNTTFAKSYQNYLADLAPAYETMENLWCWFWYGAFCLSVSPLNPFIPVKMKLNKVFLV